MKRLLDLLLSWLIADDPYPADRTAPCPWLDPEYCDEIRRSA
jgi:hypothetical protein